MQSHGQTARGCDVNKQSFYLLASRPLALCLRYCIALLYFGSIVALHISVAYMYVLLERNSAFAQCKVNYYPLSWEKDIFLQSTWLKNENYNISVIKTSYKGTEDPWFNHEIWLNFSPDSFIYWCLQHVYISLSWLLTVTHMPGTERAHMGMWSTNSRGS